MMPERDREALRLIQQKLAKEKRLQERRDVRIEEIRVQLERIAREAAAKYQREVEALRPVAKLAVDEVIQPWFYDLISSGTYKDLLKWSRSHEEDVRLSETILYYWPEDALSAFGGESDRPYLDTAKYIVEEYKRKEIQVGIQRHSDSDEVWYAGFKLEADRWREQEGVRIWRQPTVGMGIGFAVVSRSYEIPVDVNGVGSSFNDISPEVWIEFGKQVESGKVWEVIEQSLRSSKIITLSPEESRKSREEDRRRAEEYLRNRQWY